MMDGNDRFSGNFCVSSVFIRFAMLFDCNLVEYLLGILIYCL